MWQKLEPMIARLREQIQDSPIVIELKSRFSELDPKTQQIVTISGVGIATLLILVLPISLAISVSGKKSDYNRLQETIYFLKKSDAEIDFLKDQIRQAGKSQREKINPNASLEEIAAKSASQAAIGEGSLEIKAGEGSAEGLTINLNKISIRQLKAVMYSIETSGAPVEISGLDIDLRNDRKGYMWAKMVLQRTAVAESKDDTKKSFTR